MVKIKPGDMVFLTVRGKRVYGRVVSFDEKSKTLELWRPELVTFGGGPSSISYAPVTRAQIRVATSKEIDFFKDILRLLRAYIVARQREIKNPMSS